MTRLGIYVVELNDRATAGLKIMDDGGGGGWFLLFIGPFVLR